MTAPVSTGTEKKLQLIIDLGERLFVLLFFATFVVRLSHTLYLRPYNLLALLSEGLVAFFIIVRRPALTTTLHPFDWAVAFAGSALPMFVRAGGKLPIPATIGTALMFAGLLLAVWSKLVLRKSFGMVAANRGPISTGPYRGVRHPMYTGYIVVYFGFLLNNPLAWNLVIYGLTIMLLVARIFAEEKVLTGDPRYASYSSNVRYRLLPFVF